jgi:hypothetical protein
VEGRVSRRLSLGLAGLALLLAAALVGLAVEVRLSQRDLRRDDALFARSGTAQWRDVGALGIGRRLLAVDDDVAFRRAAKRFEESRPDPAGPAGSLAVARQSRAAERILERIAARDPDRKRRAAAANLLGILAFESARANPEAAATLQRRSLEQFTAALRTNQLDDAAKFNLELALALSGQGGISQQGNGRGNQAATVGAVVSPVGSGY